MKSFFKLLMIKLEKLQEKNCYGSGDLAGYAEDANTIRTRFPEHIKRIPRDVQEILIG